MEHTMILGIVLLIVGFIFVGIELKIPGFGVFGFLGVVSLVFGVILAAQTVEQGVTLAIIVAVLLVIMITVFLIFMQKKKKSPLVLGDELTGDPEFLGNEDMHYLIGSEGKAITDLRPLGNISINYIEMKAKSVDGKFIRHSERIKVVAVADNKLLVEKI